MYLTRGAMRSTLAGVAGRSAPGSTPDEMAADLRSAGLVVHEDSGMTDWNARFAQGRARVDRGSYMRIAIARTD